MPVLLSKLAIVIMSSCFYILLLLPLSGSECPTKISLLKFDNVSLLGKVPFVQNQLDLLLLF